MDNFSFYDIDYILNCQTSIRINMFYSFTHFLYQGHYWEGAHAPFFLKPKRKSGKVREIQAITDFSHVTILTIQMKLHMNFHANLKNVAHKG